MRCVIGYSFETGQRLRVYLILQPWAFGSHIRIRVTVMLNEEIFVKTVCEGLKLRLWVSSSDQPFLTFTSASHTTPTALPGVQDSRKQYAA